MCNSSCQTQLPWHIASSQAATLTIAPAGTIGVLASSFDAVETGDFDWADYTAKVNFFDETDMTASAYTWRAIIDLNGYFKVKASKFGVVPRTAPQTVSSTTSDEDTV
jgi:hypothetical protein